MSEAQASLNVTDIADAVKCIDHAAQDGAYKGWENIRQVLILRDRLDAFSETQTLNVTDIADAIKCIDHAAQEGAYKGWETIRQVLILRDRLEAFTAQANAQINTPAPVLTEAAVPATLPSRRTRQQRKDRK